MAALWSRGQHRVMLFAGATPAGEALIDNGRPRASRRSDHDGFIEMHGRRYDVQHSPRWRSTLRLGDRVVAVGRKGWFGRSFLVGSHVTDSLDELALALFWFAVTPGRPGAIWMTFESL